MSYSIVFSQAEPKAKPPPSYAQTSYSQTCALHSLLFQSSANTLKTQNNWTPRYPRNFHSHQHIMLRVMSSAFLFMEVDDGYMNVPSTAIAYPLCSYRAGINVHENGMEHSSEN